MTRTIHSCCFAPQTVAATIALVRDRLRLSLARRMGRPVSVGRLLEVLARCARARLDL